MRSVHRITAWEVLVLLIAMFVLSLSTGDGMQSAIDTATEQVVQR